MIKPGSKNVSSETVTLCTAYTPAEVTAGNKRNVSRSGFFLFTMG
jgi:hypothetical protein